MWKMDNHQKKEPKAGPRSAPSRATHKNQMLLKIKKEAE